MELYDARDRVVKRIQDALRRDHAGFDSVVQAYMSLLRRTLSSSVSFFCCSTFLSSH